MSIKFLVLLCHLIITFSNKNKIFWRYFCTLSTEHTDHAENVSTQHVQKNVFFAHPHRNLLPLLRWTWIECNHEERTAGLTQGWRSVKFSYFYCVWGFATQIYGGLWIPPSITDKCKDRRWNSVFQHSTWFFFPCTELFLLFSPFIIIIILLILMSSNLFFKGSLTWHCYTDTQTHSSFSASVPAQTQITGMPEAHK